MFYPRWRIYVFATWNYFDITKVLMQTTAVRMKLFQIFFVPFSGVRCDFSNSGFYTQLLNALLMKIHPSTIRCIPRTHYNICSISTSLTNLLWVVMQKLHCFCYVIKKCLVSSLVHKLLLAMGAKHVWQRSLLRHFHEDIIMW